MPCEKRTDLCRRPRIGLALSGGGARGLAHIGVFEVLTMVAQGASDKEIGRQRHISEATVKTHPLHIFEKLGVNDRTQVVIVAAQHSIVT